MSPNNPAGPNSPKNRKSAVSNSDNLSRKGRPCAKAGCKALAMQGSIFCHGHNPQAIKSGGAPEGNANALVHGLYSKFLTSEEQQALMLNQEIPGLDGEIQAARVALMRALRGGTTDEIIRASQAVGRLMEMARRLAGEQAEGIVSALSTLLSELGVGENSGSGQEAV